MSLLKYTNIYISGAIKPIFDHYSSGKGFPEAKDFCYSSKLSAYSRSLSPLGTADSAFLIG